MQLYINNKLYKSIDCDNSTTLLHYLRAHAELKGTKEGCASGDCGACTVMVKNNDGSSYSLNSCITPLGSMTGKSVWTVEGLQQEEGLHPVQQAMMDCHGSQCGFCTPGFVMSLANLYEQKQNKGEQQVNQKEIETAISGNLCRCTGYKPILAAGEKAFDLAPVKIADNYSENPVISKQSLSNYFLPENENELQTLLQAHPGATLVTGATDLALSITQQYKRFATLIDLTRVQELTDIKKDSNYLVIGAAATYQQLDTATAKELPELHKLLHRLGSSQIRNRGSVGGNIANASPIADTPPALLAWLAEIEIVSPKNHRRWLSLENFYLDYKKTVLQKNEYIARIRIPLEKLNIPHRLIKLSKRFEDDISSVMLAVSLQLDERQKVQEVRIAYGGMAAIPKRAIKTEQLLLGQTLNETAIQSAGELIAEEFSPLSDVRASSTYRLRMAQNLLRRALLEIRDGQNLDIYQLNQKHSAEQADA